MNIILGATGQIGSAIVKGLVNSGKQVKAVVRNTEKAKARLTDVPLEEADYTDTAALTRAFEGGDTVFLLTPENPQSEDVIGNTKRILDNYRAAIEKSGIKKIVGLSSMGAHYDRGTGNLVMSYLLEHAFSGLSAEQVFIRPSYYYSNWLHYLNTARKDGVLPTFFPPGMQLSMIAPLDVAQFAATSIVTPVQPGTYEVTGPRHYSSADVADSLSKVFDRPVTAQQIPKSRWKETLLGAGFSESATANFIEMTQAVIDGKTAPQLPGMVKMETELSAYLKHVK